MGVFDNASSITIGGKEVESMKISSNNAVIYEKQPSNNYDLNLASDKNSLSYSNNESANLSATLTNNNSPVSGEIVDFYEIYERINDSGSLDNLAKYSQFGTNNSSVEIDNGYKMSVPNNMGNANCYMSRKVGNLDGFSVSAKVLPSSWCSNGFAYLDIYSSDSSITNIYQLIIFDISNQKYCSFNKNYSTIDYSNDGTWTTNVEYKLILVVRGDLNSIDYWIWNNNSITQIISGTHAISSSIVQKLDSIRFGVSNANTGTCTDICTFKDISVVPNSNGTPLKYYLGSDTTNNNGIASINYVPQSTGTMNIKAEGMGLSDELQIQVS